MTAYRCQIEPVTAAIICLQSNLRNPLMRASVERMLVIRKLSIGAYVAVTI